MAGDPTRLETPRLSLRRWRSVDLAPFAALNADPEVTEYLGRSLARAQSDAFVERIERGFAEHGFGFWALEVRETGAFIGFTGLSVPRFHAHFTPAVEIGWRLARSAWGYGYATEAAGAALEFGFDAVGLSEIVSFTTVANTRSRAVMHRLGMTRYPADDFDHPQLSERSPLRRHVLYRTRARVPILD